MRTAKRALSLLLIAVMVLLDIPQVAFAADEPVYQPDYNQYPIFSGQAKSKLDQFIETDGNSVFNVVGRFTKVYALGDYPDRLSFSSRLTENDYGYYQMGFSDVEKRIAAAGELGVALHAQITNDKHWSIYHALSTETSANVLRLSSGLYSHHSSFGELLHSYDSIEHASSGTYEYTDAGANAFPSTGASTWQTQGLTLEHRLSGDACGAPSTGNIAVMLADLGGPKVQSIYTTAGADPSSDRCEKFKAGETIYVHLRFDEPIRLSTDNAADLAGLTLKVAINDTKTGAEVGGTPVTANIVSLKSDTMTFKCVVPASIDILGQPVTSNHYLSSVRMSDQSWVTSNIGAYALTYVYEDGAGKHSFGPKDPADNPTLTKTSSLITDFAGNPILRSAVPIYLSQPCYMDNVAPTVASVTPVAVEKNANSDFTGIGQTFITAGDKIEITAEFSEEMQFYNAATGKYVNIATNELTDPWYDHCRVGLIRAGLNLKDDLGNPIVVTGKRAVTSSTGVNGIKVTKVVFELTVPPGARPIVYGSTAYALSINRITVDDAAAAPYRLCDSRGNPYVTDTVLLAGPGAALAPTRELWLDTLPPVAEVEYGPEGESDFYLRVSVDDPIDSNEDLNGQGAKFRSETTGMFGTFRWTNGGEGIPGFKYEYAYVSSPSVEAGLRTYWQAGENETQPGLIQLPDDGLHIHFRLLPDSDYSIVGSTLAVEVFDKAGNRFSTGSSPGSVDLVVDTIGPVVTRDSYAAEYVTDHGEIEASIRVKDVAGKVACIEYLWVEWADGGPPDAGATWYSATDLPSYSGSPGSLYKTFDASLTNLGLDEVHEYSLFVRTLDESGDELPGRAGSTSSTI